MARTPQRIIEAECNQIRRLLEDESKNWTDSEIMEKLGIKQATYYNRKLLIAVQDKEAWQKTRALPLEKRALDILKAFNDGYKTAVTIRDNTAAPEKDRLEAAKTAIKCKVNIFYLMQDGPSPNFKLPPQGVDPNSVIQQKPTLEHR
jgi:hypothetical protein